MTSGHTTAKITYQHGLTYNYLINSYDNKLASGYLESNENAIKNIKNIIDEEKIECDFENQNNYVYTTNTNAIDEIQKEVEAINTLKRRRYSTICNKFIVTF